MAVSLDTYDEESGIHPRNKQLVSKRLATSGLNVAYGKTDNPTNGPFPKSIQFTPAGLVNYAEITFNEPITFDAKENNGFYYCCEEDFQMCDQKNAWKLVIKNHNYLFCPIYLRVNWNYLKNPFLSMTSI